MADGNMTPSRVGQKNATGAVDATFLMKFAGEVLEAFDERQVMRDRHLIRTIENGKSAQFPASWKANAGYHTPGNLIIGSNQIKHNERVIYVDDMLISDVMIPDIDQLKNHYDYRMIYTKQIGEALANQFDKNTLQVALLAARASATIDSGYGGTALTDADALTNAESLANTMFDAAQTFDEKDVPDTDRCAVIKPAQYYALARTTKVLNRDWGGDGSYSQGKAPKEIAGIELVKSNHLPQSNVSATTGENNTYSGDFSNVAAAVFHQTAMGTVKLMDLAVQKTDESGDFAVMYQGTLLVAKYVMGHGILRPECAIEVKTA